MNKGQITPSTRPPKPKTKEQIALEMDINLKTLQRRLKKAGLVIPRGLISPEQQDIIFRELGWMPKF